MELATDSSKPALKLQAHASMGQVLLHVGQTQAALDHLKSGLDFISNDPPGTLPEQNAAVACAAYAAWSASLMGASVEADGFYQLSRQLQKAFNNPFAEAIHFALCSEYFMFEGDVVQCLAKADRAVEISRKHNFPFWLGTGLVMRGWALGQQGAMDDAFAALQEGITVFEATGAGVQLANWYGLKAETLLAGNHIQAGLEAAERALQYAEKAEDVFFVPRIHAIAACLQQRLGNMDRYQWHSEQASSLALRFAIAPRTIAITDKK
jgi:tetratricopeptide (TPR) repeat protein